MEQALSYVLVTPYTVAKSRTGGVLSRLLSRIDLELVGAQMIALDSQTAEGYASTISHRRKTEGLNTSRMLSDYILAHLAPTGTTKHRTLLLLFRGTDPCEQLAAVCGRFQKQNGIVEHLTGESIRDTYADLIFDEEGASVTYFEPAVITAQDQEEADETFSLFSPWLKGQPNIIEDMPFVWKEPIERTLTIIKPDNWRYASSRPGMIIDMFSRTGLRIVGMRVLRMSVDQALQFYGPVREALRTKLAPVYGSQARKLLESDFSITLDDDTERTLSEGFGTRYADEQFERIVDFMSGIRPSACPPEDREKPGLVKCMVIIYEGEDAVRKIRAVLGPTDPNKAEAGTIRREFGTNIRINAAHASDSVENAKREMGILGLRENSCARLIAEYLAGKTD